METYKICKRISTDNYQKKKATMRSLKRMLKEDNTDVFDKYFGAPFVEYNEQLDLTNNTENKETNQNI